MNIFKRILNFFFSNKFPLNEGGGHEVPGDVKETVKERSAETQQVGELPHPPLSSSPEVLSPPEVAPKLSEEIKPVEKKIVFNTIQEAKKAFMS